jgi:hypothetical protein
MAESQDALMTEFLSWVSNRRRTYAEAMEAWQSHCPRQTIWEDAIIGGFVEFKTDVDEHDPHVVLTTRGRSFLGRILD